MSETLRPSAASTSLVGVAERHAPGLGESPRRPWSCRRPSGRPGRGGVGSPRSPEPQGVQVGPRRCAGSRRPSRRRTSPARRRRARARPSPRRRCRRPGRRRRPSAGGGRPPPHRSRRRRCAAPAAPSRSASSPRGRAAPRRWTCPPSVPPERPDVRRSAAVLGDDLVVGQRAGRGGELEPVADLDALDRLDAHQRPGQPRVEPPVPVHVGAEARRQAVHDHLDDAARGCRRPCGPGRSARPSRARRRRPGSAPGPRRAAPRRRARGPSRRAPRTPPSSTTWESSRAPVACSRKCEATRPSATRAAVSRAEARSRTGRASSKSYFCMPTRSAWPGRGRVSAALRARAVELDRVDGVGRHHLLPLGPLGVADLDRDRSALVSPWRTPPVMRDLVLLELHPRAAAVAQPAAGQRVGDVRRWSPGHGQAAPRGSRSARGRGTPLR